MNPNIGCFEKEDGKELMSLYLGTVFCVIIFNWVHSYIPIQSWHLLDPLPPPYIHTGFKHCLKGIKKEDDLHFLQMEDELII